MVSREIWGRPDFNLEPKTGRERRPDGRRLMAKLILAIDQGTTGTRTYLFDHAGKVVGSAYQEFTQYFPKPGWVEHDADEIWRTVEATGKKALKSAGVKPSQI